MSGGRHVLLVEDDDLVRMLMAESLADAGFTVVEAATGDEAVNLIGDMPVIDLLLTDIQMRGCADGNVVANVAKRRHEGLPVIYMTGNPGSLKNRIGATDALMRKPFSPSEVVVMIGRLLR